MELAAAALLGVVQGLTEFLPISSSAHLILVPWLLGWEPEGLAFDVSLHVGTAAAVLAYFRTDWITLAREGVLGLLQRAPFANPERRLAWYLVVGVLPAVAAGLLLEEWIEQQMRSPLVTVVTLIVFARRPFQRLANCPLRSASARAKIAASSKAWRASR